MRLISVLVKKELNSFFKRPTFYVIAGFCCLIWSPVYIYSFGVFLTEIVGQMGARLEPVTYHQRVLVDFVYLVHFVVLFFVNGITMKLLAEEKKSGTFQLMMTYPLSLRQIVLSKYISGVLIIWSLIALSSLYPLTTSLFGPVDIQLLGTSYLGLMLFAMVYVGLGLLASAISSSVLVAFILALVFNLSLWFLGIGTEMSQTGWVIDFFNYINLEPIFEGFTLGAIRLGPIVYLVSFSLLCCFFTERMLISMRWK